LRADGRLKYRTRLSGDFAFHKHENHLSGVHIDT
jgi:hypothetical protein